MCPAETRGRESAYTYGTRRIAVIRRVFDKAMSIERSELTERRETNVGRRRAGTAIGFLVGIAILIVVDLADDWETGVGMWHLLLEAAMMSLALGGIAALWWGRHAAEARAARLDIDLEAARTAASQYKAEVHEALRGLGEAIDSQFERWQLTPAEREVGLLLLKGLSHKEIAEARATSEATVRQQALVVYRKSGLRNRSDLAAFFLEDLLLPRVEAN